MCHMKLYVGTKGLVVYEGKILLLRESGSYGDGTQEGLWDFPGGRIEPEETLERGFIREIREETGLSVRLGPVLGAFDGFPEIRGEACHVVRVYFLGSADTSAVRLSEDHDQYVWVTPKESEAYALMDDLAETIAAYMQSDYISAT